MGRTIFPTNAVVVENAPSPYHPSQIELRSRYSADVVVIDYGFPLWRGAMVIDTTDTQYDDEVDSWLTAMDGAANWALLPHHRKTIPDSIVLNNELTIFPYTYTAAAIQDIEVGQYVHINSRVHRIVALHGVAVTLWPNIKLTTPATMYPCPSIPARLLTSSGRSYSSERNADWYEPWRITWEEVLGVYTGDNRGFGSAFTQAFN